MLLPESCDYEGAGGNRALAGGLRGFLWLGKSACGSVSPIYHLLPSKTARVVEWQTRTFEGRMPKGMRVQVPPRARSCCLRGNPKSRVRYSMDEVIGHARNRKNERPFRINSFHPNDLVARSKRKGRCTAGPRAINSVFGFFLANLDCQRLPVVGIKLGPTFVLNEYSLLRLYHRGQKSGLRHGTAERDATSERHQARYSPIRLCFTSLRAGPVGDLRRTKARLTRRSRGPNQANWLNHRLSVGIPYQRDPPGGMSLLACWAGLSCGAKQVKVFRMSRFIAPNS